jgi:hypothetical protein
LDDWEKYYHADRLDPLVQLAMIHGQFEIIHPFLDGNGRIGRILIPLFLYEKGLLSRPVFYLSAYIEAHKEEYASALGALSSRPDVSQHDQAWNRWVVFFLEALTNQAQKNLDAARSIIGLYERSKAEIIRITHSQYAVPLLDLLFRQPVFSPAQLERHGTLPSKQMTMSLLGRLKDRGILVVTRESSGRRPQILAFAELVNLCEGQEVIRRRRKLKPSANRPRPIALNSGVQPFPSASKRRVLCYIGCLRDLVLVCCSQSLIDCHKDDDCLGDRYEPSSVA